MNSTVFIAVNFDSVVIIIISAYHLIHFVAQSQKHDKHLCGICRRRQDSPEFESVHRFTNRDPASRVVVVDYNAVFLLCYSHQQPHSILYTI